MRRISYIVALSIITVILTYGCTNRSAEEREEDKVLTFEKAQQQEPALTTTDEIAALIKADSTHRKIVYWFDALCKPCRQHLREEVAEMYKSHDTNVWRFYLVAGFNHLKRLIPDSNGNLVEDTAWVCHFAEQYRQLLPSLGYDMKDAYFHYDPAWERSDNYGEEGVFTPLINGIFHSDHPFRADHGGMPQLFKADRHNFIQTNYIIALNDKGDTIGKFYCPDGTYTLDTTGFYHHDTLISIYRYGKQ